MANHGVHTATYNVPADAMWKTLSNWASPFITDKNSPASVSDLKGTGVGATRSVNMLDGSASWTEKVTKFDEQAMTWTYVLTSSPPPPFLLKLDTFACSMSVKAVDANTCEATIESVYDMCDGAELFPPEALAGMYKGWADAAADYALTKFSSGRDYLAKFQVQEKLQTAVAALLRDRPTSPMSALAAFLGKSMQTPAEPEVVAMLEKFCSFSGEESAAYATDDCLFNPPGAPPMPIADVLGMMAGSKQAFPRWESKFWGALKNADGTYTVLTQQCLGPMLGDFPAMGPFPAVPLEGRPAVCKEDWKFPVEAGTYTLSEDKTKVQCGAYNGAVEHVAEAEVSPFIQEIWNKKGDQSDTGFGAAFILMGVPLGK